MPFVGREREVRVASDLVGSGSGSAGLFVGESGSGKTAMARELAARHGAVLVTVSPNERMWPLSGLTAVAAALDDGRRAAVDGVLARGRDWPEHLIAEEVSRTLHLVRGGACVVVIDDLDDMDSASITVLSYVFGRLRGTGVSVLATSGTLEERHDFAGMMQTRIRRLSFDESVDLARSALGDASAPAVLRIVAELSAGDPGVLAGLRLSAAEATGDEPLNVPLRLRDQAPSRRQRREVRALDPRWGELLDLLAVGPVYGTDRLRRAARESGADVDDLVEEGLVVVRGQLSRIADPARRLRRHAGLGADDRRRLHARAADDHAGAYPAIRGWHGSFLEPHADREPLLAGAVLLAHEGEAMAAVEFAERALAGDIDEALRSRRLVDLGEALVFGGHDELGQHYLRRAGASSDPDTRARGAMARLRALSVVDHVVDDSVLTHVAPGVGAEAAASERLLCESAALHLHRGEVHLAAERISTAVEIGVASTRTALLAHMTRELGGHCPEVSPVHLIEAGESPADEAILTAGVQLLREDYASARQTIRAQLDRRPRLAPLWREHLLRQLVTAEVRAGDPTAAREAVTAWQHEWLPGRRPDAASTLILAAAALLETPPSRTAELVRQGRERARRERATALLPWFCAIDGLLALREGRPADAVDQLRTAQATAPDADPAVMRIAADLVEALWLAGRRAEALHELDRLERLAAASPRRWTQLALARARAVCRSAHEGAAAFSEVAALFRPDDAPFERENLRLARLRCLPDDPTGAIRALTPASEGSLDTGALSPNEQDIVALVERGLRNREIAAALYISLRTVELRLTGIYRKLGITSRVQLIAHLHGAVG